MKVTWTLKDYSNKELLKIKNMLEKDLFAQLGDSKNNLIALLNVERELTLREEQP